MSSIRRISLYDDEREIDIPLSSEQFREEEKEAAGISSGICHHTPSFLPSFVGVENDPIRHLLHWQRQLVSHTYSTHSDGNFPIPNA